MFGILTGFQRAGSKLGRAGRGSLSRKHGNKNYYRGTGARTVGHVSSTGKFVVDKDRLLNFQVPDLTDFQLKPYVTKKLLWPKESEPEPVVQDAEESKQQAST